MSPLEIIRQLASQVRHVNPSALSRPQKQEYVDMARKVYTPRFMEAVRKEEKWRELAAKTTDPVQRAKYLEAARNAEYEAARFSKLDQAAGSIGKVNKYDDEFRALTLPGHESGIPGGIATYYPPGHTPDDAMLADSTYLELLGTSPDVKGAGRVLLRQTGMTSPSNPMTWHSTSYPETMGFYESRGAELIPKDRLPKDSAMYGNLPVFRVPRGDILKEKGGGSVSKPRGWSDFITAPGKASSQLHVSERDVQRGEQLDLTRRQAEPTYPSIENAERLPSSRHAEQDDALFREALLRGPDTSMTASPSRSAQIARAALGGAGSFGGWTRDPIEEPTPEMLARLTGEMLSDPLNAVGLGALKFLGRGAKKLVPAAVGLGTSAYASDAGPKQFASGGLVKGLKMLFPNAVAPMHVVKPKGGNWLTGSVEGALGGLRERAGGAGGVVMDTPMNQWIEGPLTKYVKTRMASPEDEVRRLAEEGVLHIPAQDDMRFLQFSARTNRNKADSFVHTPGLESPGAELGISQHAKRWEDLTDSLVTPGTFKEHLGPSTFMTNDLRKVGGEFAVQNPDALAYQVPPSTGKYLGFDHLVDEQKIAASQELANKASVVREYAPSEQLPNPKGLRWVELKANEVKQNADLSVDDVERMTREERQNLEKQLKYEGDTMGHCVGGYCDEVISGQSRIFSLRDAKGEPHVTVEVDPTQDPMSVSRGTNVPRITKIKGKQNRKPNDEYLPFVQDFVRNSPLGNAWSNVGDLQNTGLRKTEQGYFTQQELENMVKGAVSGTQPNFASGGVVQSQHNPWSMACKIQ